MARRCVGPVVLIVFVHVCNFIYYYYYTYNKLRISDGHAKHLTPTQVVNVGRQPNDGVWYNFSVPPALLFFAYTAFVDVRTSSAAAAVVRVIAISTKSEDQRQHNVTLFCIFNYKDGRPATVSRLVTDPSPIGYGYPLYGIQVKEYIYACPVMYNDLWPISLSIFTEPQRQNFTQSGAMPVEVPATQSVRKPLATCVQVAYERLNPVRLVEWLEFQRLLGVSLVGVYLASDISESAEKVFRHYADVDGLVDLRRSDYISRVAGGSTASPHQYMLHWSPTINDCIYRNMFRFSRIAVIDFDEVFAAYASVHPSLLGASP